VLELLGRRGALALPALPLLLPAALAPPSSGRDTGLPSLLGWKVQP